MVSNPIRKRKDGWYWGSSGPFSSRKKAAEVARAAYSSGYTMNPLPKPTKAQLKRWAKMPDPFADVTEEQREEAWKRGAVI